jgi:NADH-quinone oxidoreductase subunit A
MTSPIGDLALYWAMAFAIVALLSFVSGRFAPKSAGGAARDKPYECGVSEPVPTEARWPVRFALVAMLFLVFDVEAVFLYPWALLVRELGWAGLGAMSTFFVVLGVGYLYARGRNALTWR